MRTVCLAAVVIMAFSIQGLAQFFPKSSLDPGGDDFKAKWYSTQLRALREPSLFALAKNRKPESCRFLWLRTFHHPVAVRIDLQADGSWIVVTKVASGAGGYSPGTLISNASSQLPAKEAQRFLSRVEISGFWNAPNPVNGQTGKDGSQWIIEGVKAGRYHVVDRWMPKNGPARYLGLFLAFDLAGLSIPKTKSTDAGVSPHSKQDEKIRIPCNWATNQRHAVAKNSPQLQTLSSRTRTINLNKKPKDIRD